MLLENFVAFAGTENIAFGGLEEVATAAKKLFDTGDTRNILVFDAETSEVLEIDFRGTEGGVLAKLHSTNKQPKTELSKSSPSHNKPGRPKLGVIGREVTLLPQHWVWLNSQPGGASVALRKLVHQARHGNARTDQLRQSQEATFKFISAIAGNEIGFEEAARALFANDEINFSKHTDSWPVDIRQQARSLFTKQSLIVERKN